VSAPKTVAAVERAYTACRFGTPAEAGVALAALVGAAKREAFERAAGECDAVSQQPDDLANECAMRIRAMVTP